MKEATTDNQESNGTRISLVMGKELAGEFFPILQRGFGVMALVPCTIRELLCDQLGLEVTYVSERITTIFLDGRAIDSMNEVVGEHSLIALSAAMPGLAGATLRRGSYYAAMRSAIAARDNEKSATRRIGMIRIKLFNLMLQDMADRFLKRGIFVSAADLGDFFIHRPDFFWEGCSEALIDGRPVAPILLKRSGALAPGKSIELSIAFN